MLQTSRNPLRRILYLAAAAVVPVVAALALGQLATFANLPWYAGLTKPSFNPPNWIFGPVWIALYGLMAFAAWRIMRLPRVVYGRHLAISLFFIQLTLNAAWSWMFFGAHSPLLGAVNIVPQFLMVIATAVVFYRLDRPAGWCLIPLVAWVGFASILNVSIWRLNM
jgi:tryptophan-rich sensory protein